MTGYIEGIITLILQTLTDPNLKIDSTHASHDRQLWVDWSYFFLGRTSRTSIYDCYSDINITEDKLTIELDPPTGGSAQNITLSLADPTWPQQLQTIYANWATHCHQHAELETSP